MRQLEPMAEERKPDAEPRTGGAAIALYFSIALLLTAASGAALAASVWLGSRWLAAERARFDVLDSERRALENLSRTATFWYESIADWRAASSEATRTDASESTSLFAREILAQVEQLTDSAIFAAHPDRFDSIVRDAGHVGELFRTPGGGREREIDRGVSRVNRSLEVLQAAARREVEGARSSVDAMERGIGQALAGVSVAYGILVLFLLRWTRRRVLAPIGELTLSARNLLSEQGDEMPALADVPRELRDLSTAFSALVRRMRDAQRRAEAADRAKSQFLANMSHEIRSPMMLILGYADQLMDPSALDRISPEQHAALEAIRHNGDHLLQILNDLLDLSRIEVGRLALHRVPVSPVELVSEVRALMQMRAREAKLGLEVEYETPLPATIATDPTRLRQVLINLVGNAIKFTDRGGVRIAVRAREDERGRRIEFDVVDSGIGMSEAEIARIFAPFEQADSSSTRAYGGAGLGLSICQRLVGLLEGAIEVESRPGEGSRFRVSLPLETAEDAAAEAAPAAAPQPQATESPEPVLSCRVLLVEDGVATAELIRTMLARAGAKVELARNGREALERMTGPQAESFDLVLMDMQMPVLDGYAATRALRERGFVGRIIALTAHALAEEQEACLRAGCDDVATKPIDRRTLVRVVARHTDRALDVSTQAATRHPE